MEINNYFGKVIFDFAKVNNLSETEHHDTFKSLGKWILNLFLSFVPCEKIEIKVKDTIQSSKLSKTHSEKKLNSYEVSKEDFISFIDEILDNLYFSDNFEVNIFLIGEQQSFNIFISMDPVYFSLEEKHK